MREDAQGETVGPSVCRACLRVGAAQCTAWLMAVMCMSEWVWGGDGWGGSVRRGERGAVAGGGGDRKSVRHESGCTAACGGDVVKGDGDGAAAAAAAASGSVEVGGKAAVSCERGEPCPCGVVVCARA